MQSFCEKYSLNNPAQYGFTKDRNTTTLLEEFSDYVNTAIENNHIMLALFLDLSKAFDTIDHTLLLQKLDNMGFRGQFHQFLEGYFTDRSQCVRIEDKYSEFKAIKFGAPQ